MPAQAHARTRQRRKSPVFSRLEKALPVIKSQYGVRRIGIFGSFARGDAKRTSDVDVLVEFQPGQATFDNFMRLVYDLEDLFKRKVDLLTVAGIDKYIRPRVEREVVWVEG
ncbi:MAG: Nucleotidyltransferase domain protein [Methanoregula sp. PtaU1.Bin051]|nr:MAG: Nucleotidyltransferase domain protein [Methanoregula sp. PtaU1.Bin051]